MDSTTHIGRVGALAVALGIGIALTSGSGIASANEGDGGGATSSDSATKPDGSDKTPLGKLGDRVRNDIEAGVSGVGGSLKRAQSRLEKARNQVEKTATRLQRTAEDVSKEADNAPQTPRRRTSQRGQATQTAVADLMSKSTRIIPEAAGAVPELRRSNRTNTSVVKVEEAVQTAVEPIAPALSRSAVYSFAAATAPLVETAKVTASPVVSTLRVASALVPWAAGDSPLTPGPSPAVWALMAWARRESENAINPNGASLRSAKDAETVSTGAVQPMALMALDATDTWEQYPGQTPAPVISGRATTTQTGWTTGPTETGHWYVAGTDLGIMWDSGYRDGGKPVVYTLFGDTYSETGMAGDWRNNVLLRSSDTNLADGLQFSEALIHAGAQNSSDLGTPTWYGTGGAAAGAGQIVYDPGYDGLFGTTYTMIPTSAIAVPDENAEGGYAQYATVMSVRTWDNPGSWTTNYSGIAVSKDGGKTWAVEEDTVRSSGWLRSSTNYVAGDEHFQQNALAYGDPDDPNSYTSPDRTERYIYVYGTPSGRSGSAYLARVPESELTNLDRYQYFAGENSDGTGNWVTGDPYAATPVIGDNNYLSWIPTTGILGSILKPFISLINGIWVGGLPTGGNVSEMSVQYNEYLGTYVVTYTDASNNVVMRVSDSPQGEWSNKTTLVQNQLVGQNTGMYAPMIHPLSGTDALGAGNEKYLYFNLSQWNDYNVRMMQADLSQLTIT